MSAEIVGRAKGGVARAEKLTATQRSEIARRAAAARWAPDVDDLPIADYSGVLHIGDAEIPCAVLSDERRVITQLGFLRAIGRGRPRGGSSQGTAGDGLPAFLFSDNLKPFISEDLRRATEPVIFRSPRGGGRGGNRSFGYLADLLPAVCNVYLDARRAGSLLPQQWHVADACEILLRGLAHDGIIGLVDEATGYQEFRAKRRPPTNPHAFLRKEFAAWAKTFPDEFYQEIFRLRGWPWKGRGINPPQIVAYYTKDIVYHRLAPGLVDELERRNPMVNGRRQGANTQLLTDDVGHPALAQHLHTVIAFMRAQTWGWDDFMLRLNRAIPKRSDTMQLRPQGRRPPPPANDLSTSPGPLFERLYAEPQERGSPPAQRRPWRPAPSRLGPCRHRRARRLGLARQHLHDVDGIGHNVSGALWRLGPVVMTEFCVLRLGDRRERYPTTAPSRAPTVPPSNTFSRPRMSVTGTTPMARNWSDRYPMPMFNLIRCHTTATRLIGMVNATIISIQDFVSMRRLRCFPLSI